MTQIKEVLFSNCNKSSLVSIITLKPKRIVYYDKHIHPVLQLQSFLPIKSD